MPHDISMCADNYSWSLSCFAHELKTVSKYMAFGMVISQFDSRFEPRGHFRNGWTGIVMSVASSVSLPDAEEFM